MSFISFFLDTKKASFVSLNKMDYLELPEHFYFSPTGSRNVRPGSRKQQVPRFMKKNGLVNIRQDSKEKFERFISDFFTTMGLWGSINTTS